MVCSSRACGPDESFATFDVVTRTDEESSSSLDLMHLPPMVCVYARVDLCVCGCVFTSSGDIYFWKVIWKVGHSGKFKCALYQVIYPACQNLDSQYVFFFLFIIMSIDIAVTEVKTT